MASSTGDWRVVEEGVRGVGVSAILGTDKSRTAAAVATSSTVCSPSQLLATRSEVLLVAVADCEGGREAVSSGVGGVVSNGVHA